MKALLLLPIIASACTFACAQSFSGHWKGAITRDFGASSKTDSIDLYLEQSGSKITGFSVIYVRAGMYIKSKLEGSFQAANQMLRLTETAIEQSNIPGKNEEIFLDRYLLHWDDSEKNLLTGITLPCKPKALYSRSRMAVKKE